MDYSCCRTANEICDRATKSMDIIQIQFIFLRRILFVLVIAFTDLAGHTKYMKTTILGLSSRSADFAMLCVDAPSSVGKFISNLILIIS